MALDLYTHTAIDISLFLNTLEINRRPVDMNAKLKLLIQESYLSYCYLIPEKAISYGTHRT
jgi:hypothetical protein